jgi:hypothetical protein
VMKANSRTKMISAVQFTSCTAFLPVTFLSARPLPRSQQCESGYRRDRMSCSEN